MEKQIMVLSGHAMDIRINGGRLKIKDGFPAEEGSVKETYLSRGTNDVDHIVILGNSGAVTFDAIQWMMEQNVLVTMLDYTGDVITEFMPQGHISGITKRRQATADNAFNMKISAWLLGEKFRQQRFTLQFVSKDFNGYDEGRTSRIDKAIAISNDRGKALSGCINSGSQMILEAQTAAAYWQCFEGIQLNWQKGKVVPEHWQAIQNRTSPKTGSPRKAIDPFNACLNYLYAVLESRTKYFCIKNKIDPDFGIIHADHQNRESLIFDLMEPIRPKVDRLLYEWIRYRKLNAKDFFETREGICKVMPEIAKEIIPLVKSLDWDISETVKDFARYFKNGWTETRETIPPIVACVL
ncbi:MAG: CRISPR-associated endonuclease Cas1 [Peptococcaceae bacterium]|jgi:CRISPR-associated endonuclease Cas1|nr:CRISPR-associated endonuclease Cas1 [Peptococcaceae bacterium]